jgi:hypothetical protein
MSPRIQLIDFNALIDLDGRTYIYHNTATDQTFNDEPPGGGELA